MNDQNELIASLFRMWQTLYVCTDYQVPYDEEIEELLRKCCFEKEADYYHRVTNWSEDAEI